MPIDPSWGNRIIQALLAGEEGQRAQDKFDQEDEDRQSYNSWANARADTLDQQRQDAAAQGAQAPTAAPMDAGAQVAGAPAAPIAYQQSPFQAPVVLDPTKSPFKPPKNVLPGAPATLTTSPSKMAAAQDARRQSVADLYRQNSDLLYTDQPLSLSDTLRVSTFGDHGDKLLTALQSRHAVAAEQARAALTAADAQYRQGQQNQRTDAELADRQAGRQVTAKKDDALLAHYANEDKLGQTNANLRAKELDPEAQANLYAGREMGKFRGQQRSGALAYKQAMAEAAEAGKNARSLARTAAEAQRIQQQGRNAIIEKYGSQLGMDKIGDVLGQFDLSLQGGGMFSKPSLAPAAGAQPAAPVAAPDTQAPVQGLSTTPEEALLARRAALMKKRGSR